MVIKYDRGPVLARIAEIEVVLRSPATPRQLERVVELALEVAEKLPAGVSPASPSKWRMPPASASAFRRKPSRFSPCTSRCASCAPG